MKKIILTLSILCNCCHIYSQTLAKVNSSYIHSGVCIERSIDNFITISKMSRIDFESQMKSTGANITYSENFCVVAAEQISGEGLKTNGLDGESFIFQKCDDGVQIIWYGSENASGFKNIMDKLQPYYLKTVNNVRGYGVSKEGEEFLFTLERSRKGDAMFETMKIVRVK